MTASATEAVRLRSILDDARGEFLDGPGGREGVTASVTRRGGFQNDGASGSGHALLIDEPVSFGGRGEAPDPAELLLMAAGASLSVTLTAHAALRGLALDAVDVRLSADIDGAAFFLPGEGEAGLLDIAIDLTVRAPIDRDVFDALLAEVMMVVPVIRTFNRAPALSVTFEDSR